MTLDNKLSFSAEAHSNRFLLYNIMRILPFLTREEAQALVRHFSSPTWTTEIPPRWSPCAPGAQPPQVLPHRSASPLTNLLQLTSSSRLWYSTIVPLSL